MAISDKDIMEIRDLYKTAEQAKEQAEEKIRNLQEKIKKGAKSGNLIQDFVILHCSSISPKYQQVLKNLEEKINSQEGKEILIAKETKFEDDGVRYLTHRLIPPPKHYKVNLELKIGIISRDITCWNVLDGEMVIPVQNNKHLEARYEYQDWSGSDLGKFQEVEWQKKSGEIKLQKGDLNYLIAIKAESYTSRYSGLIAEPKILIGQKVEDYFTILGNIDDSYCKAMDLLQDKVSSTDKGE